MGPPHGRSDGHSPPCDHLNVQQGRQRRCRSCEGHRGQPRRPIRWLWCGVFDASWPWHQQRYYEVRLHERHTQWTGCALPRLVCRRIDQGNFNPAHANLAAGGWMAEESTSSVNGWVVGAIASAVAGLALLGYSTRRTAVATSVPV